MKLDREKIVYKKVEDLKLNPKNPRKNDEAVRTVAKSIEKYGFKNPLIIDENNVVWCGNTRLKASRTLGLEEVPCIVASDLTEEQIRELALIDNKSSEIAEWNFDLLGDELLELDLGDFELDWGLPELVEEEKEVEEDDFDCTPPEQPKAKLGDIYQLGNHRLMCGDSTKEEDVARLMNGNKADMVFTDPPYNVKFNGRSGNFDVIKNDDLSEDEFNLFITSFVDILNLLNPKHYYIWCNWKFYGILQELLDFKACIVWAKNVFGLGKGYRHQHEFCLFNGSIDEDITNESDLWEVKKDTSYMHPTQKPLELSARAIKNHKSVKNVVDLFGGSGGTIITCEQLNRNCYMMELDPKYVDVIIARWEQFTGKKAEKIN
jgi:site-specific DNA-methyltransferase (adenine-specific)